MKRILTLALILLFTLPSFATHWYVSAAGSNSNSGTSTAAPLLSITGTGGLNSKWASIAAGDTISFRGGDTFTGTVSVGKSGTSASRIVINSYGTGRALLTGYQTLSGFTITATANVYSVAFSSAVANLMNVSIDGQLARIGRTPNLNAGDAPTYEAFTSNTSITDNQLTSTVNWTGAEVVIRNQRYLWNTGKVTAHVGGKVTYTVTGRNANTGLYTASLLAPTSLSLGNGYFFQNDLRTLDQEGEWYLNPSTKVFYLYSTSPGSHTIKASTRDTLINLNNKQYITIDNLNFEGANLAPVSGRSGLGITVKNSSMTNNGYTGIQINSESNTTIDNVDVVNSLSSGIQATCANFSGLTIKNSRVTNTYPYVGMGDYSNDQSAMRGIQASADNLLVYNNIISKSGYSGIAYQGNNTIVRRNTIDSFCMVQDDNAGIYTYVGANNHGTPLVYPYTPTITYTNRIVDSNIIENAVGNSYATNNLTTLYAADIYCDGMSMNILIKDNYCGPTPRAGITMNNPSGITLRNNTLNGDSLAIRVSTYKWGVVNDFHVKKNLFIPTRDGMRNFNYTTDSIKYGGTIYNEITTNVDMDSNYYYTLNPFTVQIESPTPVIPLSLVGFQAATGLEAHAVTRTFFKDYGVSALVGSNKHPNPSFTSNITGITVNSTIGATVTWDNTNQITNGTLKVTLNGTGTTNNYARVLATIGALDVTKSYLIRFKTKGTTANGLAYVYLKNGSTTITDSIYVAYGTTTVQQEFLIRNPATTASAVMSIDVNGKSGTMYMDDFEVFEATIVNRDLTDSLRVEKTRIDSTVNLAYKYNDFYGNTYNTSTNNLSAGQNRTYFFVSGTASPTATITTISPSTTIADSIAYTLTINGTGFDANSVGNYNGVGKTTTFVGPTQITIPITAFENKYANTGQTIPVKVTNSVTGDITSTVNQTLTSVAPSITSISPTSGFANGIQETITLNGSKFINGVTTLTYNGSSKAYTFISPYQLTFQVTATDKAIANGGTTVAVVATNPSNVTTSSINYTLKAINPVLTSINPTGNPVTGSSFVLTVTGSNFISGKSFVYWNGVQKSTTFVNSGSMTAVITAGDNALANAGTTAQVTVQTTSALAASVAQPYTLQAAAAVLTTTITNTPESCYGGITGTVTVTPAGGTAPYTYVLKNSAGTTVGTTATVGNLPYGTYTSTVTDNAARTATGSTTIAQPTRVTVTGSYPALSCSTCSTTVTLVAAGGTPTYTYSKNGGTPQTSGVFAGLVAGTYNFTIKDSHNCAVTSTVKLTYRSSSRGTTIRF